MTTIAQVIAVLQQTAPFETQLAFDNAGLLIGSPRQPVGKIGVALDATLQTVQAAAQAGVDLMVTHHPVIFTPLKHISAESAVYRLIQNGIGLIAAHTNLDAAPGGVNDGLARRLCLADVAPLAMPDGEGYPPMGRMGRLPSPMSASQLADWVCERLATHCRYTAGAGPIEQVAVCGGAGGDILLSAAAAGVRAVVTSEVKHHLFLQAAEQGITLIDAGHFETENGIVESLRDLLGQNLSVPVVALPQDLPTLYR